MILLSAYCGFDYALNGIQYGVANYLLKHELNEETLPAIGEEERESLSFETDPGALYKAAEITVSTWDRFSAKRPGSLL